MSQLRGHTCASGPELASKQRTAPCDSNCEPLGGNCGRSRQCRSTWASSEDIYIYGSKEQSAGRCQEPCASGPEWPASGGG
eukprot:10333011-Alexandrium_andersonii.AAC.1